MIMMALLDTSSLLQGKYLPFSPSPLCLNIFRLFVILSLTQLYRYTPEMKNPVQTGSGCIHFID
jgi:hypothetical protein